MGNLGDLSPQGSVAVGVIVGLVSTSVQAIGLTLQRKSHMLEDEKHPYDLRRPPYKRRRWQLGMLMFVISNIVGSTIQITTLPLPVLSTLQASGLVFNTIFATLILGEPFTRYSLFGTILVCIGAVLIATFGAIGEPAHTLDQLLELLQRRNFILWMVGTAVLMLVILLGCRLLKYLASPSRSKHATFLRNPHNPHVQMTQGRVKLIRGMCYGLVSGILSAHTLLLAKSAVELLVRTVVDRANQFNRWQSWMILIGMILLALTQLFYLHRGLKLCSTSVLYPFVFCIYNIIAILDGLIYFRQVSQLAGLHAGLIALGTIVLLGGVLCLSWRLEDIDSHAGVTVVGPSQTALGPGMGIVEEHPSRSGSLQLDDEERQVGEREPLLSAVNSQRRSPHQRAPSLPLMSPFPHRNSTSTVNPASIWAELDDSDYEYDLNKFAILNRPSLEHFKHRPRSQSGTFSHTSRRPLHAENSIQCHPLRGIVRHSTAGPVSHRTWNSRWRRTSAPVAENPNYHPRPRTLWGAFSSHSSEDTQDRRIGYGTYDAHPRTQSPARLASSHHPHSDADGGLLAGSRSAVARAWSRGLRYLRSWTGTASRSEGDDDYSSVPDDRPDHVV